jgi:DNA repair exonuclease SbcCD ATPase subunit
MKKIVLNKLVLTNFKGIKHYTLDFDSQETNIHGKNGSGKTTVADAYSWLLFGKNSQNQTDFGIKTLDTNNDPIHNLNHSVEGVFTVDDSEVTLKRVYSEKWTKKKGNETQELTGHSTDFFFNNVPCSLSEYKLKVDKIISEEFQKLLSNPLFFNQSMKWNDRRVVLSKIVGEISDSEVYSNFSKDKQTEIQALLSSYRTLDDYKREYAVKRKKIKDELDLVPSRIDEATRSLPDAKNWEEIEKSIEVYSSQIKDIDAKIEDATKQMDSKFTEVNKVKQTKFQKEQELQAVINEEIAESKKDYNNLVSDASNIKHIIQLNKNNVKQQVELIQELEGKIKRYETANNELRNKFTEENAKDFTFDSTAFSCNSCQREYDTDKIEEIKANALLKFKAQQEQIISEIRTTGGANKVQIEKHQSDIEVFKKVKISLDEIIETKEVELKVIEEKIKACEVNINSKKEDSPKVIQLKNEIDSIVIPEVTAIDNLELKTEKVNLLINIDNLKLQLHDKLQIEKGNARIEELNQQQKTLSQEIANLEKTEMIIDQFQNSKMKMIEEKVNDKFKFVKFKMFQILVNGGISEDCTCLINGVEFNDANTASKINAGIEVINVLSSFYEISCPVIIDGRESISKLIQTDAQIINLIVDSGCEKLTVK